MIALREALGKPHAVEELTDPREHIIIATQGWTVTDEGTPLNDNEYLLEELLERLLVRASTWIVSGTFIVAVDEDALDRAIAYMEAED